MLSPKQCSILAYTLSFEIAAPAPSHPSAKIDALLWPWGSCPSSSEDDAVETSALDIAQQSLEKLSQVLSWVCSTGKRIREFRF